MTYRWRPEAVHMYDTSDKLPHGWNDPKTWDLNAEDRSKVFALYRESTPMAAQVLKMQRELVERNKQLQNIMGEVNEYDEESEEEEVARIEAGEDLVERGKRINNLRVQIPRLHSEYDRLASDRGDCDRGLKQKAMRCSMLLCPPYAALVMAGLPPLELRNHVYDYLWNEKAVNLVESQLDEGIAGQADGEVAPEWVLRVPYFADANYVGEAFAREAATLFWRLIADAEVHYRFIRPFLNISSFGNVSLRPCDIIRRLVIDVGFSNEGFYRVNVMLAELMDNLESLLTLPVKGDFEIIIYIDREVQFSRTLFKALEVIRPTYHALVKKGMKVKVLGYRFFTPAWRNHNDIREEATIRRPCTTAEQLNYYFAMTPIEWLDMKEGEISAVKQPVRREKCMEILNNMRQFVAEMELWTNDQETEKVLERLTPKAKPVLADIMWFPRSPESD